MRADRDNLFRCCSDDRTGVLLRRQVRLVPMAGAGPSVGAEGSGVRLTRKFRGPVISLGARLAQAEPKSTPHSARRIWWR
jgi:hypothetical protein